MSRSVIPLPCRDTKRPIPASAGVGLRPPHHELVRISRPDCAWFEIHPENFMQDGMMQEDLTEIAAAYPISFHAVGLSLGSADGIDREHLHRLNRLTQRIPAALISDHLSWSRGGGIQAPDLLPLPYDEQSLRVVVDNIDRVQDALGRSILIENPSVYLRFISDTMPESVFLATLCARTGCGILLDINNIYVSARNLGVEPAFQLWRYLIDLPTTSIGEFHLAGHSVLDEPGGAQIYIDDHGGPVSTPVWDLFEQACAAVGPRPTLIEWDTDIPSWSTLIGQTTKANAIRGPAPLEMAQYASAG